VCVCVKEIVSSLVIGPDGSEPLTGCDSSDKEGPSNVWPHLVTGLLRAETEVINAEVRTQSGSYNKNDRVVHILSIRNVQSTNNCKYVLKKI